MNLYVDLRHKIEYSIIVTCFLSLTLLQAAVFFVTNTNDSGAGSLRAAITNANTTAGFDQINFNIPGGGVQTIFPLSQLPPLLDTFGVVIDGLTQPGAGGGSNPPATCTLLVEVDGTLAGPAHGFWVLSPNNIIQGLVINNFQQHGIRIQGIPTHTHSNLIAINYVGVDPNGSVIQGNGTNQNRFWGGIYIEVAPDSVGFAHDNYIDMNLSSGNYAEGIGISSCPPGDVWANYVFHNYVGVDRSGSIDLGNVHDGVYIGEGAHDNLVDGNLISGNDFEGVCIIGYPPYGWDSHDNTLYNNVIGLDINQSPLGNTMDGVSIGQYGTIYQGGYATHNIVDSNIIAHNGHNGITVWEHSNNTFNCDLNWITQNSIYSNGGLGIDLTDDGVTLNDVNDPDVGPNEELNFPVITSATYVTGTTTVSGSINIDSDPTQARVEVFRALLDPSGYGEGWLYLGFATPGGAGNWQFITNALSIGDLVTATTTDMNANTSEFAQNFTVVLNVEEDTRMESPEPALRGHCTPNPFTTGTTINLGITVTTHVRITIFDAAGQKVRFLEDGIREPGHYSLSWDGRNDCGVLLPAGIYFCCLENINVNQTITMIKMR